MIKINKAGENEFLYRVDFDDGKVSGFNTAAFKKETQYLTGKFEWVLRAFKKRRSTEQNNTMWMYFNRMAEHTGHTKQYMHSLLSFKFLLVEEVDEKTGEVEKRVKGTSELDTIEHNIFMENIRDWSLKHLNLELPLPDKNWKFNFE